MSLTANLNEWEPQQRRTGSIVALVLAVVLAGAGVGLWFFMKDLPGVVYWVLVGLLALVLVFVLLVLAMGIRADRARTEPHAAHVGPAGPHAAMEPAVEAPAAAPGAVRTMGLRCGDCGTVFDITDTGERPLYHTCPGCGAEGVLRAPPAEAAAPAAPQAEAAPDLSAWAPPPAAEERPAPPPAPAAPTPRRLKLRCGGCKEVFVIEDTGERPLRRPCPHCSRMGEIR